MSDHATFPHPPKTVLMDRYEILDVERYWSPSVLPDPIDGHWYDTGARGVVYRGQDMKHPEGPTQVSIKHVEPTTDNPDLRELTFRNCRREADIQTALSHPSVPPLLDYFKSNDQNAVYSISDYVEGITLDTVMNSIVFGTLTLKEIVRWGVELCDVIAYLHEQEPPLLFRTLGPNKIMIDTKGHLRLIDFSGASTYKEGVPGASTGVDGYAAPEQYQRLHHPQSDVFSIGALLHHLLTQQDPRYYLRFSFHVRRIEQINPAVSATLVETVHKALEVDPDRRFQSARDLQNALKSLV